MDVYLVIGFDGPIVLFECDKDLPQCVSGMYIFEIGKPIRFFLHKRITEKFKLYHSFVFSIQQNSKFKFAAMRFRIVTGFLYEVRYRFSSGESSSSIG